MGARKYTPEQDQQALDMHRAGATFADIGRALGISRTSAREWLHRISLHPPVEEYVRGRSPTPRAPDPAPNPHRPAWRRCLYFDCGQVFWSPHAGIRQCPECRSRARSPHYATPI